MSYTILPQDFYVKIKSFCFDNYINNRKLLWKKTQKSEHDADVF